MKQYCTQLPIICRKTGYDIHLYGGPGHMHFVGGKRAQIRNILGSQGVGRLVVPKVATKEDLRRVHTAEYLAQLADPAYIAAVMEAPFLAGRNLRLLQRDILTPLLRGTGGTLLGVDLALEQGIAINLSGGFHHAKPDQGGGFCLFADIPLAILHLQDRLPNASILVIDLDAHFGDGVAEYLPKIPALRIVDVFNKDIFPPNKSALNRVQFPRPVTGDVCDDEYLFIVRSTVREAFTQQLPDFVFYNAGADILDGDPCGRMKISAAALIERDKFVVQQALAVGRPILITLGGAYSPQSPKVIADSIKEIAALKRLTAVS